MKPLKFFLADLRKKRNYGEQRENQIIDFLISRGVLDGETIN